MVSSNILENSFHNKPFFQLLNEDYLINRYFDIESNGQLSLIKDPALLFNAHTHLCRANWKPIVSDLNSFLKLIMQYRAEVSEAETIDGVIKALNHMVSNGIQGYISHQNHRHIHAVIRATKAYPLNHNFARMCTDNADYPANIRETPSQSISETINLSKAFPDIGILYGPMGLVDCSLEMFEVYGSISTDYPNIGLQTHVAEEYESATKIKKRYGKSEIELLLDANCLSENTFLVHSTHVTDDDIEIILDTKTKVILCPRSSFKIETFLKLIKKGVPLMLGTDAYNLYKEDLNNDIEFIRSSDIYA